MTPTDGNPGPARGSSADSAADAATAARRRQAADGGIMSFGDHLEELRACSIRALVGLVATTIFALIFAKAILAFILKPALVVLEARGQRPELQALSPPDTFIMYLKMALICGVILAMPWIIIQIWRFVALGLYEREKRFVRMFAPISVGLFITGVVFMFFLVLPVVLNFFITFTKDIRIDDLRMNFLQSWVVGEGDTAPPTDATDLDLPYVPVVSGDPENVNTGGLWFDQTHRRLCVRGTDQVFAISLEPSHDVAAVRNHFSLSQYIGFVLMLSLGFGIAFELPLVVLFITAVGILSVDQLARWRRHIILFIFLAAAILTPPDVISQVLLAIPMLILFEASLWASRRFVVRNPTEPRP